MISTKLEVAISSTGGRAMQFLSFAKTFSYVQSRPCLSSFLRSNSINDIRGGSFLKAVTKFCSMAMPLASPSSGEENNIDIPSYPLMMIPPEAVLDDNGIQGSEGKNSTITERSFLYFLDPTNKNIFKVKKPNWNHPWQDEVSLPDDCIWVGSSHGWVTFVHPRTTEIHLVNPFLPKNTSSNLHRDHVIQLPPIETLPFILSVVYKKEEGGSSAIMIKEFTTEGWHRSSYFPTFSPKQLLLNGNLIKKVVLSAPPVPSQHNFGCNDECIVLVTYGIERVRNGLAFCRLGDTSWTELETKSFKGYDVVYSAKDKLFYAYDYSGGIRAWNHKSLSSSGTGKKPEPCVIHIPEPEFPKHEFKIEAQAKFKIHHQDYLVDCSGDLLVVRRFYGRKYGENHSHMTLEFQVQKWVSKKNEWEKVEDIDDAVIFVGTNHAVSLSATQFPKLRNNSIYFTDLNLDDISGFWPCHDMGIYDLFNGAVKPISLKMVRHINPLWVVPTP